MTTCTRSIPPEEGRQYSVEVFVTHRFVVKVRARNETIARTLARNKVAVNGTEGIQKDEGYLSVTAGDADSKDF